MEIVNWSNVATKTLPEMKEKMSVKLITVELEEGATEPPGYLTESDLIEKMEKFGIGTDASMATHINNICERGFVSVANGRRLIPNNLGIALIECYHAIDKDLSDSKLRQKIEKWVGEIATGKTKFETV